MSQNHGQRRRRRRRGGEPAQAHRLAASVMPAVSLGAAVKAAAVAIVALITYFSGGELVDGVDTIQEQLLALDKDNERLEAHVTSALDRLAQVEVRTSKLESEREELSKMYSEILKAYSAALEHWREVEQLPMKPRN